MRPFPFTVVAGSASAVASGALLACVVAVAFGPVAPARAGCVGALVVDGSVLYGVGRIFAAQLPARGPEREAVSPACNDTSGANEPDRRTTARTLRGLPARVAVVDRFDTLYYAEGSVIASARHPLHLAIFGRRRFPNYRRRHACRPESATLRGAVVGPIGAAGFTLRRVDRTVQVAIDYRTTLADRPAYQPLLAGQRVALRTSLCGPRRVADQVAFLEPTIEREPVDATDFDFGGARLPGWVLPLAAAALLLVTLVVVLTRWRP